MLRRVTFTRAMHTLLIAVALVVSSNPLRAQCVLSAESIGTGAMLLFQSGDVSQLGDRAGYRVIIPPCGIADLLNVWMGKVKVYIQHFPGVPNPNNVTTPTALISVRGTIFDVEVQDDGATFVTLDEGLVDVRHLQVASRIVSLHPGESVQVLPNIPLAALPRDKGYIARKALQIAEDTFRQLAGQRTGSPGPGGTPTGPVATGGGK